MDEIAARQKQREEEAEARRAVRKTGGGFESAERIAPRLNIAPRTAAAGGGGWRDRLAAKGESPDSDAPEPAPAREEAPRRSGYVPPHLRAGASAGSGSASPPPAPREPREAPTERFVPRHTRESSSPKPEEPKGAAGGKWVPRWKQQQS